MQQLLLLAEAPGLDITSLLLQVPIVALVVWLTIQHQKRLDRQQDKHDERMCSTQEFHEKQLLDREDKFSTTICQVTSEMTEAVRDGQAVQREQTQSQIKFTEALTRLDTRLESMESTMRQVNEKLGLVAPGD